MNFRTYSLIPLQISDTGAGLWLHTLETTVYTVDWVVVLKLISRVLVFVAIRSSAVALVNFFLV